MSDTPTRAELLVAAALYLGLHMRGLEEYINTLVMHAHAIEKFPRDAPYIEAIARARALLGSEWRPIETAPKDRPIDIWVANSDGSGTRWTDCTHDQICNEWRNHDPGRPIKHVHASAVTHWRPLPAPPVGEG